MVCVCHRLQWLHAHLTNHKLPIVLSRKMCVACLPLKKDTVSCVVREGGS